jgi:hypothetical protein
LNVPGTKKKR